MSGPKVLTIVTRQQILEICGSHIAEIDAAIAEWERIAERNNLSTSRELAGLHSRRQKVVELLDAGRFVDIQKEAPLIADSIRQDIANKVEQQYLAGIKLRNQARSLRMAASALLKRCRERQIHLPPDLSSVLENAESSGPEHKQQLERSLSQALRMLDESSIEQSSRRQSQIAQTLGASGVDQSLDDWIAENASSENDPRVTAIEHQIALLASLDAGDTAEEFAARCESLMVTADKRHRELLIDSLRLELAAALKEAQHIAELRHSLLKEKAAVQAAGELSAFDSLIAQIDLSLMNRELSEVPKRLEQLRQLRVSRQQERLADSGRQALLRGLKDLGYEVREGMSMTWTTKKRLVVQHSSKAGVALELGGDAASGRIQARMVALQGVARSTHSDKQVEEQWCDELGKLQSLLAAGGGIIQIEKAIGAGVHPLKVTSAEWQDEDNDLGSHKVQSLG